MRKLIFILWLFSASAWAQDIRVQGGFLSDSVQIGKPVYFYLSSCAPEKYTLLYPDSTYRYTPFEFRTKKAFPTQTRNGISIDSAVYTLASYEIDSIQSLKLPVYRMMGKDSLPFFSDERSILFHAQIKKVPDSTIAQLPLKINTRYRNVWEQINYGWWAIIGFALGLILLVLAFVFRKKIEQAWKRYRLTKKHKQFIEQFTLAVNQWKENQQTPQATHALMVWKKYMEYLLKIPVTTYTTREIKRALANESLTAQLTELDKLIYGQQTITSNPFSELRAYGEDQYFAQLEKWKA